jgi:hypothetical protein
MRPRRASCGWQMVRGTVLCTAGHREVENCAVKDFVWLCSSGRGSQDHFNEGLQDTLIFLSEIIHAAHGSNMMISAQLSPQGLPLWACLSRLGASQTCPYPLDYYVNPFLFVPQPFLAAEAFPSRQP